MRLLPLLCLCAWHVASVLSMETLYDWDEPIAQLHASNFSDIIWHSETAWVVVFYLTWCGHCKRYAPIYTEFARQVEGKSRQLTSHSWAPWRLITGNCFSGLFRLTSKKTMKLHIVGPLWGESYSHCHRWLVELPRKGDSNSEICVRLRCSVFLTLQWRYFYAMRPLGSHEHIGIFRHIRIHPDHYTCGSRFDEYAWWRHQMETFSALLAICAGNSPVPGEFPAQRPVTWSFDVFFDLHPNKRLSKQWWGWWFVTPSCPLWRHHNGFLSIFIIPVRITSLAMGPC